MTAHDTPREYRDRYPFYLARGADAMPLGDDAYLGEPMEGPCYYATVGDALSDAADLARIHGGITVRERLDASDDYWGSPASDPVRATLQAAPSEGPIGLAVTVHGTEISDGSPYCHECATGRLALLGPGLSAYPLHEGWATLADFTACTTCGASLPTIGA